MDGRPHFAVSVIQKRVGVKNINMSSFVDKEGDLLGPNKLLFIMGIFKEENK